MSKQLRVQARSKNRAPSQRVRETKLMKPKPLNFLKPHGSNKITLFYAFCKSRESQKVKFKASLVITSGLIQGFQDLCLFPGLSRHGYLNILIPRPSQDFPKVCSYFAQSATSCS